MLFPARLFLANQDFWQEQSSPSLSVSQSARGGSRLANLGRLLGLSAEDRGELARWAGTEVKHGMPNLYSAEVVETRVLAIYALRPCCTSRAP